MSFINSVKNCTTDATVTGFCSTCNPYPANCSLGWDCTKDWTSCDETQYCCTQIQDTIMQKMAIAMCMPDVGSGT